MFEKMSSCVFVYNSFHFWRNKLVAVVIPPQCHWKAAWCQELDAGKGSMSGRFADFVIDLREGILTPQLISQFMVQLSIKHLPKLLSVHVHICIQHLEPAYQWNTKGRETAWNITGLFHNQICLSKTYPCTSLTNFSSWRVDALASKCLTLGSPYAPISTYSSSCWPLGWTIPLPGGNRNGHSHRG